jgi:hypothetical protein
VPGRIVLYGATGYTGGLTARSLLDRGMRPVLAGRDPGRLDALAERLCAAAGGTALETAVADAKPERLRELVGPGDVLVSTAGPFLTHGRAAVTAATDAGAVYLDSTGEPPFIRRVFEEFGPRAERTGATLLTAFGYDYVPGNLAGALALRAAGPAAVGVRIGYFIDGNLRRAASAGTRASVAGLLLEPGYAFRHGRLVAERTAARVRSFRVAGATRAAFSIGSSEHFALPRLRQEQRQTGGASTPAPLSDVDVYLGWFGRATRLVQYGCALAALLGRVPGARRALDAQARRIQRGRSEPDSAADVRSRVVAVALDGGGRTLAEVDLTGGSPYPFTAAILAWGAQSAAALSARPAGAPGPVEVFGLDALEAGCAGAGFRREPVRPGR